MKDQTYTKYRIIKDIQVRSGIIAPWFDEVGNGIQYNTQLDIVDDIGNQVKLQWGICWISDISRKLNDRREISMDKFQLQHICSDLGIKVIVNDEMIKEQTGYYENYNQIENNSGEWYFSEMNFEKRPSPEKEKITKFLDEEEAVKFFFIMTFRKFISKKIHLPNNPIRSIRTFEELINYFDTLGVKREFYSFSEIRSREVYAEVLDDKIVVSYIDNNKQRKFTTMPLDVERGIFIIYRLTYALHFLNMVETKYLDSGLLSERFNDDDIAIFIK